MSACETVIGATSRCELAGMLDIKNQVGVLTLGLETLSANVMRRRPVNQVGLVRLERHITIVAVLVFV